MHLKPSACPKIILTSKHPFSLLVINWLVFFSTLVARTAGHVHACLQSSTPWTPHSIPPLEYNHHPLRTTLHLLPWLTLLGKGPWVLWPIGMFLRVWANPWALDTISSNTSNHNCCQTRMSYDYFSLQPHSVNNTQILKPYSQLQVSMTSLTNFFALAPLPCPNPFLLSLIGSQALSGPVFSSLPPCRDLLSGIFIGHQDTLLIYKFTTANYHSRNS